MWLTLLCVSMAVTPLFARDVNLDGIYFKKTSSVLYRLINVRLEMFNAIGATLVERDVVCADWLSGSSLFYVREFLDTETNIIYQYNVNSRRAQEIGRFRGGIIQAKLAPGGGFAVFKLLGISQGRPVSSIMVFNVRSRTFKTLASSGPNIDYTITPEGSGLIYETSAGLTELDPLSGRTRVLFAAGMCNNWRSEGQPVLAFPAPGRGYYLIVSGGAGQYTGRLVRSNGAVVSQVAGISSASEIQWRNANELYYRTGSTGLFSVRRVTLSPRRDVDITAVSLNTNLSISPRGSWLVSLRDGCIMLTNPASGSQMLYAIEGEDISFAPNENDFCTLYSRRLFVCSRTSLERSVIELRRQAQATLAIYREAARRQSEWANSWTGEYLRRKTALYEALAR